MHAPIQPGAQEEAVHRLTRANALRQGAKQALPDGHAVQLLAVLLRTENVCRNRMPRLYGLGNRRLKLLKPGKETFR